MDWISDLSPDNQTLALALMAVLSVGVLSIVRLLVVAYLKSAKRRRRAKARVIPPTYVGLALVLLASPAAAEERLSAPAALAWAAVPMSFDLWTTDHAVGRNPKLKEWNKLGQTAEKRQAVALAGTAAAALAFYHFENGGKHWSRKVPRYMWVAAHVGAGLWNLRQARR